MRAWTAGGAYDLMREDELGTLEAGKLADIVILSGNPFEMNPMALRDLEVETTIFNGRVVYRKDEA